MAAKKPHIYLNEKVRLDSISKGKGNDTFKTKLSSEDTGVSEKTFKEKVGEPHPFDYSIIEGIEQKFALVTAIEDKILDYAFGSELLFTCDDEKVVTFLEDWCRKTHLEVFVRPWVKSALGKGTGWLEVAGLSDDEFDESVKVSDANTIFVKRDEYGKIINIRQYLGKDKTRIEEDKVIDLNKDEMIQLNINQLGNCAYGTGIVYSAISTINYFLGSQSSMHKLMERKANSPIHVKIGNIETEDYPEEADINAVGKKLQFMNNMTEWATGPNVEMKVIDFGNIGDKFEPIIDNDLKMLAYSFQVPEAILGKDKGFVGSSEIQEEGFQRNIRSYQVQAAYILKTKLFDKLLEANKFGTEVEYSVDWNRQTEKEKNALRTSYMGLLSNSIGLSPGMKKKYEQKLADLEGFDYGEIEAENEKEMRRENREGKKEFNRQLQITQTKGALPTKETCDQCMHDEILEYHLQGLGPQEIEIELADKYEDGDLYEAILEEIHQFDEDIPLEDWVGEYVQYKNDILVAVERDAFELLKANSAKERALGKLTKKQVEKVRTIMKDGFENKEGIRKLSKKLDKIGLKDRYKLGDKGEKVLSIKKEHRPMSIARSETVRLRAEGQLESYKNAGKELVQFELVSARPCAQCEALDGSVQQLNEASGIIPVHANCRCRWSLVNE